MILLNFSVSSFHGWGICGKYLTRELSKFTDVKLISSTQIENSTIDPINSYFMKDKLISEQEAFNLLNDNKITVIQGIESKEMIPVNRNIKGDFNIGYTFFEDNVLLPEYIENAKKYFDIVVAGSTWCEEILKIHGLDNVSTVIQGIDTQIFNPSDNQKEYFKDKFVIFSGGKFEYRKGQDIVIKAFKILQDKYDDVLLINSWLNMWEGSFNTMQASPFIKFNPVTNVLGDYISIMNKILQENGINLDKVITLPLQYNPCMAKIYKNTDIGLFPNRCEGGTNLVLMEYMACGKPVIASYNTGHKDVLSEQNSIMLKQMSKLKINNGISDIAEWDCPSLDETVASLEWAYENRDKIKEIGNKAGQDSAKLTWQASAQGFYNLAVPN